MILKTIYTAAVLVVGVTCVASALQAFYLSLFWEVENIWIRLQALAVVMCVIVGAVEIAATAINWVRSIWENKQ